MGLSGFLTLIGQERVAFGVTFDLQTLIFSTYIMLCGTQMIWFAVLSKASSISKGFMPKDQKWESLFSASQNEKIYLVHIAIMCTGLTVLGFQVDEWISRSFGELDPSSVVRTSLLGGALTFLGFQALISHFLLSIILLGHNSQKTLTGKEKE
jgi:hypothetical protein